MINPGVTAAKGAGVVLPCASTIETVGVGVPGKLSGGSCHRTRRDSRSARIHRGEDQRDVRRGSGAGDRSQRNAAQYLAGIRGAQHGELLRCRRGCAGIGQNVGDAYELVRVGAGIAIGTDGRGDGPDGDRAVGVDLARKVAQSAVRRGKAGRIIRNGNRLPEVQTVLQHVDARPGAVVQHPLLQPRGGAGGCVGGGAVAFIGHVQRGRIREEKPERKLRARRLG